MKKPIFNLVILSMLALVVSAETTNVSYLINQTEEGGGAISAGSQFFGTGLLSDWRVLSILFVFITLSIVALARMIAEPFNLPELKAWANIEWTQTFVTVVLVVFLIAAIEFIDLIVIAEVNLSPGSPVQCEPTEFCLIKVANTYLTGLIDLSESAAREAFVKSISAGKASSSRITMSCGDLLCLWSYISWGNNPFLILDIERYNQEIEMHNNIIYSLSVQRFFVNKVAYYVGPALLLIGIVGRSFFLTRRIGGLMMATAIGIMFVFPIMYLWNMITINVAVFGDKLFANEGGSCPKECGYVPALAIKSDGTSATIDDLNGLTDREYEGLRNGSLASVGELRSCEYLALNNNYSENDPKKQYYCASECRELPYPYWIQRCSDPKVELACMELPNGCKIIRNVSNTTACGTQCPSDCKIVPPLNGGPTCQSCFVNSTLGTDNPIAIPFSCRVTLMRNFTSSNGGVSNITYDWPDACLFNPPISSCPQSMNCTNPYVDAVKSCHYNKDNAADSCTYVVPDIPDCECLPYNSSLPNITSCCIEYPGGPTCRQRVNISAEPNTGGNQTNYTAIDIYDCSGPDASKCLNYTGARFWNNRSATCTCFGSNCTSPSKRCEGCLNVTNDYCLFNPPIVPDCSEECINAGISKPALLTPAEFAKKSSEGMFGREDIKAVSRLLLPAYLLPLINIVVTLMFIRTLSPILGGDIEIPGYFKVL